MSLTIVKGQDLLSPEKYRGKILAFALPGFGKTEFLGTACPDIGIAACETGHGRGMATIEHLNPDLVFPESKAEMDAFVSGVATGKIFGDKGVIGFDSLSYASYSLIKDFALSIPRNTGNSPKRAAGIPELDDYGVMGVTARTFLHKLLALDKHILVTATMKIKTPDEGEPGGVTLIGPDLPGAMFTGAAAMFDIVMCGRTRTYLKDPKDAKSKVTERFWQTHGDGNYLTKCRAVGNTGIPLLDKEEPYDPSKGIGTFPALLKKILDRYKLAAEAK